MRFYFREKDTWAGPAKKDVSRKRYSGKKLHFVFAREMRDRELGICLGLFASYLLYRFFWVRMADASKTELDARQGEIDKLLTPDAVKRLLDRNESQLGPRRELGQKMVVIAFMSTASLLRALKDPRAQETCAIKVIPLAEAEAALPPSQTIQRCKQIPDAMCVNVVTVLPMSMFGLGPDKMLSHSITGLRVPANTD